MSIRDIFRPVIVPLKYRKNLVTTSNPVAQLIKEGQKEGLLHGRMPIFVEVPGADVGRIMLPSVAVPYDAYIIGEYKHLQFGCCYLFSCPSEQGSTDKVGSPDFRAIPVFDWTE